MVVRGVPKKLARNAWWLDHSTSAPRWLLGALLLGCIVLADQMFWMAAPGLGVAVWIVAVAAAVHMTLWVDVDRWRGLRAWGLLLAALIPLIEVLQVTSILISALGLAAFSVLMVLSRWDVQLLLVAMGRLPFAGIAQVVRDARSLRMPAPSKGAVRGMFFDWALPLGVGSVFVVLMASANPVVDRWLVQLARFETDMSIDVTRVLFWGLVALCIWPFLRLPQMVSRLTNIPATRPGMWRSGLINERSALRALVVFNAIFAVQSLLDASYLWGGVALPEGMSYAQYAHRGAYPLVVTALLAGVFALLLQPFLEGRPALRALLYAWIAQNILLVVSSILRLDLYIDAYHLTRLRFAALIWMVVVALGLVLMIMQMIRHAPIGWFMLRAAGLGLVAVYACALVNVDGLIERTNLAQPDPDMSYLCALSEGAAPALHAAGHICNSGKPIVIAPADWREWGYRNARLRRSLAQMEVAR
ncbi:MAG: DUF4173 domain-containing protein [Pseudomonadota bacterium]